MRSFALWHSTKNKDTKYNKEISVHINLWDKKENNKKIYCFDFGLLIEGIENIENLYLYVPFQVSKSQIKDLGGIISNNQLVNAIFNENFSTTEGEPKRLIVNGTNEKRPFVIYALEIDSQIELNSCKRNAPTPGTILQIKIGGIKPKDIFRYYFRIRITVNSEDIYLINDSIKGVSIFSDQFTNTEVIDFRLNDVRSCSEELREQFDKGQKFDILAVHYLILRDANDLIINYGKQVNSRMLENDLWKKYIDGANNNIIAYHIKSKAEKHFDHETKSHKISYLADFSDLTRFQYQKGTNSIIIIYVICIIVLGAFSGIIGNWISKVLGL